MEETETGLDRVGVPADFGTGDGENKSRRCKPPAACTLCTARGGDRSGEGAEAAEAAAGAGTRTNVEASNASMAADTSASSLFAGSGSGGGGGGVNDPEE